MPNTLTGYFYFYFCKSRSNLNAQKFYCFHFKTYIMKRVILFVLAILICTGIQAQIHYEAGIKTGLNVSTQTTKGEATNVESSWKPGFHAGVYGTVFFLEQLAAQLEIMYSQKGSKWEDPYFSGKDNLSYIDIPVLARFQIIDLVNVHAGPQFSFLAGAKQIPDGEDSYDASSYYKKTDIGLVVGAEVNLSLKLNIAVRYVEGFSVTTEPTYYIDEWKNRVIQISVGYSIFSK